jgi:glycosyltransferase involved in cell wall biosynthesis
MAAASNHRWRIVHSEASPGWGGQERRIMAELEGFRRRGSETFLLTDKHSEIFRRASAAGIACKPISFARRWFPLDLIRVTAWLRRVRPHVVNPHSSRDGWLVGAAARLARVPFLVRTRHFDVPISSRHLSGFVYTRLADHVMTTSPKVSDHFRELFGLPADRVTTLPTGIDLEQFSPTGNRAELLPPGRPTNLPLIGMVSIIRHAKGHAVMLDAADHLRREGFHANYVIVGEGPNLGPVRAKVAALKLEDCVTFAGQRDDVPAVLRTLSVLVIPSLHEGIPQTGLQALATKTPVIGSAAGGIPSIIRPGETGRLVPPGDAPALAQAIRATLEDPATTQQLSERGRRLVEREHSLEGMLDQIDSLYRRSFERLRISGGDY